MWGPFTTNSSACVCTRTLIVLVHILHLQIYTTFPSPPSPLPPSPPPPNPSPPLPPPPPSHRPTITTTTTTSSPPPFTPPPPSPPPPSPPPPSPCPTSPPPLPSPSRHTDKMPYQSHLQWHKNPHNTYFENFQNILKTNQLTNRPTDRQHHLYKRLAVA